MKSRRTVILIVAVVVGAIAAFGLLNYVRNVEGSVYDNAQPETVWVVRQGVPKGTSAEQALTQGLLAQTQIPASFRPATAVVDPSTELAGLVAVTDLPANATVVAGNFVAPKVVNTGITDRLKEQGLVTVTFSVDQVRGAAYLIEPGDYVNILEVKSVAAASSEGQSASAGANSGNSNPYNYVSRYVYQRVQVLAIDKTLTPDLGQTSAAGAKSGSADSQARNGGMITLAVPPEAVQTILSIGMENLYLSLIPDSYSPKPLAPLDYSKSLLPAADPNQLTPYGPKGDAKAAQ